MIPIMQPTLPSLSALQGKLKEIMENGWITNGKYVEQFEAACAEYLEVENVVAVSSGTMALVGAVKCLDLSGEVIVPSFTWCASAHALLWNNIEPVFVDIDPLTFNIDVASVEAAITPKTSAILAVHMFGNPCNHRKLKELADRNGLEIIYDCAHAFGSRYESSKLGDWGSCSTYSLSPSKIITTGEGGLVATSNRELAEKLKLFRNQGVVDYDSKFLGVNARMTEMQAILGLEMVPIVDELVAKKQGLLKKYIPALEKISGIRLQHVPTNVVSTYKDFNIVIDPVEFGMSRDEIAHHLNNLGISTKSYYYPPVHAQKTYAALFEKYDGQLTNTNLVSNNTLTLPLYPDMPIEFVDRVIDAISSLANSPLSGSDRSPVHNAELV